MASRYENIPLKRNDAGKQVQSTLTIPAVEESETDVYIVTNASDRLDTLAYKYYGDARYWWVIAAVNNLGKGTLIVEGGIQIRIPLSPATVIEALREVNNI